MSAVYRFPLNPFSDQSLNNLTMTLQQLNKSSKVHSVCIPLDLGSPTRGTPEHYSYSAWNLIYKLKPANVGALLFGGALITVSLKLHAANYFCAQLNPLTSPGILQTLSCTLGLQSSGS